MSPLWTVWRVDWNTFAIVVTVGTCDKFHLGCVARMVLHSMR
jgi:hypothetical protein